MADFLILDDEKISWDDNKAQELTPAVKSGTIMERLNDLVVWLQSVKTKEKVIFYNLLSTMTNAWITLIKSIMVLEKQEKNPVFKKILWRFGEELREWKNLSECLALYPSSFTEAEMWIIKSWEKTGQLNKILSDLAIQLEKVESLSWKIKWTMIYPLFILVVVVWVVTVMMTMIVPKLLEIFTDKSTLPASTKALMFFSDMFRDYWFVMIFVAIFSYIAVLVWKKTPDWKYIFDNILLHIPVFWPINKKLVLSKFARTFSWLAWSWVSVVEGLKITSSAVWNEVYKQRILLLSEDISVWIKMWESLDWDKLFPEMMVQMIQVWEQTAKLEQIILKVADFYDDEVDNTITMLNKLLEPFIIVALAVIVWFIALAIMQPIMNLADTVAGG
jgi:type IV pilus assembly protein PilC